MTDEHEQEAKHTHRSLAPGQAYNPANVPTVRIDQIGKSYRMCSCGKKIYSRPTLAAHRRQGHRIAIKRYKGDK